MSLMKSVEELGLVALVSPKPVAPKKLPTAAQRRPLRRWLLYPSFLVVEPPLCPALSAPAESPVLVAVPDHLLRRVTAGLPCFQDHGFCHLLMHGVLVSQPVAVAESQAHGLDHELGEDHLRCEDLADQAAPCLKPYRRSSARLHVAPLRRQRWAGTQAPNRNELDQECC